MISRRISKMLVIGMCLVLAGLLPMLVHLANGTPATAHEMAQVAATPRIDELPVTSTPEVIRITVPVDTAPAQMPTDLPSLLLWLASGGGAAIVASFVCTRWGWYQAQDSNTKSMLMLAITAGLAIFAKLLIDLVPESVVTQLTPYVTILLAVAGSWAASQGAYAIQRAARKPDLPPLQVLAPALGIGGSVRDSTVVNAGHDAELH